MPGTDTNVTPEMDAPTMPKATIYQGECLSAVKNAALELLLPPAKRLTKSSTAK